MERIIISERDDTSNVERLASYDVAYVPGFASTPHGEYYRTPVFVSDRYEFVSKFGGEVPRFKKSQSYKYNGNDLFPPKAIQNHGAAISFIELQVNGYNEAADVPSAYYTRITEAYGESDEVDPEKTYYGGEVDGTSNLYTLTKLTEPTKADLNELINTEGKNAYYCAINPSDAEWYITGTDNNKILTTETFIDPTKTYFSAEEGPSNMFEAGDADPGYRYAIALLSRGMPVYFEQMNETYVRPEETGDCDVSIESMYNGLMNRFVHEPDGADSSFDSMGDYSVKYITSGGYPTFELQGDFAGLAGKMAEMAYKRKDSIALIDHTDNPDRPLDSINENSVINSIRSVTGIDPAAETYCAMFTPWFECSDSNITSESGLTEQGSTRSIKNTMMPGSFAYLTALASQVQSYNPWLAVSGVTRGRVPYCDSLHTTKPLTNNIADTYQILPDATVASDDQLVSINPITYIRNYGYCIWGNRTLRNNGTGTKALSFLNMRSAVSDIKKRLFEVSQQLLFEQNTDVLWLNFKSLVTPLLDTMKSDYILSDYTISRLYINPKDGKTVPAYEVMAVIRIQPINSVEIFDLTVVLENSEGFGTVSAEVIE